MKVCQWKTWTRNVSKKYSVHHVRMNPISSWRGALEKEGCSHQEPTNHLHIMTMSKYKSRTLVVLWSKQQSTKIFPLKRSPGKGSRLLFFCISDYCTDPNPNVMRHLSYYWGRENNWNIWSDLCPRLAGSLVQGGELPQVHGIHICPVRDQQLCHLTIIGIFIIPIELKFF